MPTLHRDNQHKKHLNYEITFIVQTKIKITKLVKNINIEKIYVFNGVTMP